ncbi:MAG: RusA family crossover junction endodeoxyribonuclease [Candidatus Omnitrophica bacterium]|jgi:hypothetical protein|nr:RusA family crossover junction endodeoxyribonuclease [Candidatus Omnitrophota bacterium]
MPASTRSPVLALVLPAWPASKKNSREILRRGAPCPVCGIRPGLGLRPSRAARASGLEVTLAAAAAWGHHPPIPEDRAVELYLELRVGRAAGRDQVFLEVFDLGPEGELARGRGRRQDVDNVVSTVMDALQGIVFRADSQVSRVVVARKG